jgi:hypothetical protein
MRIIPYQPELSTPLPVVQGNVDYLNFEETLKRIDELLYLSGIESRFVEGRVEEYLNDAVEEARSKGKEPRHISNKELAGVQIHARRALRCTLARELTGESLRDFSCRLAESFLFQWFCEIDRLDVIKVPGKSTLQRYENMVSEETVRGLIDQLSRQAATPSTEALPQPLELKDAIDLQSYFIDTSCVKANIHFPVDWVLLRDAARTLMLAVKLIRREGLKNRMEPPGEFLKRMNKLSIEMTHTRRKKDSKKQRKRVLRLMKRLMKVIDAHARRHRDLLEQNWPQTQWSEAQARQVIDRIDGIREQLPAAIKQAHERIIGGRQVPSKEKILSLYEPDVHPVLRHKTGEAVEFGNTILIGEVAEGVIVDWQFFQDQAPSDSRLVEQSVQRFENIFEGILPKSLGADRGFHSAKNRRILERCEIYNGICPVNVNELHDRMEDEEFAKLQTRRNQTEPRLAILKNNFLGRPMRSKGFIHRAGHVAWAVLAHNLWVIARLPRAEEEVEHPEKIPA